MSPPSRPDPHRHAIAAGTPIVSADIFDALDPTAVRMVPAQLGAVGVAVVDGTLVVAFPHLPLPATIEELARAVGLPVRIVVAPDGLFEELEDAAQSMRSFEPISLEAVLTAALEAEASDLHLAPGEEPTARLGGRIVPLGGFPALSADDVREMAPSLGGLAADDLAGRGGDLLLSTYHGGRRLRVVIARQRRSFAVSIRILALSVPPAERLGLPAEVVGLAAVPSGLVVVTAPRGEGLTTTLTALVEQVNTDRAAHVTTLERPIEYVIGSRTSVVRQREVGVDTPSFAEGLRAVAGQDVDVVMVSALEDADTIRAAVAAAGRGHLVLAGLTAPDAAAAVDRLLAAAPGPELFAVLRGVVAQRLVDHGAGLAATAELVGVDELRAVGDGVRSIGEGLRNAG
jgi:twitching motility protein PilT